MEIKKVQIKEINPAAYNPRIDLRPGHPDYEMLKKSISTFGLVEPLVWNRHTGNLVGGHQRLKILIEQGAAEVEVSVVDLPIDKEKALNLALNKIQGDWDDEKLTALVQELSKIPDFDMGIAGFDVSEVSEILDRSEEVKEDDFDFDAAVEAIKEPVTKKGDLIELGPHRLFCGDSSNLDDLKTLFGSAKANLLHTDPPYNVDYYGGSRPNAQSRPATHKLWERIYADNMSQDDYEKWLKTIFGHITGFMEDSAPVYVWNGHRQFGPMSQMLIGLGYHVSCVITWVKETFSLGFGDYNQQTEFCLYGWKKGSGPHPWYGPNNESTRWDIHRDLTKDYIHPTQKPVGIPARAIRNSSKRGDIVVDLFLGSGSTLIAAETLGRRCFGMEISPAYLDGIVRRYVALVGEDKVSEKIRTKYLAGVPNGKQS